LSRLVFCVPGLNRKFSTWAPLIAKLSQEPEWKTDTVIEKYDHEATTFSRTSAKQFAQRLAAKIEGDWTTNNQPSEIVLIGHSMGALLVRQAYLMSLPQRGFAGKEWAQHVSRIVLLSGINRGVQLGKSQRAILPILLPGHFLVKDLLKGSDFVTNLRIWWIKKLARLSVRPVVVQVRGGQDNLVNGDDSLDIEGFLEGHEMLIEDANHANILLPDRLSDFSDEKYRRLRQAILRPFPNTPSDHRVENEDQKIFFVVHGIRDKNDDWVAAIKKLIESEIPGSYVMQPYLGRFSALHFMIPAVRRVNVRKFQDLYSSLLAANPLAKFYFVGHSYGTYVFGHSLLNLTGIEFERVLLAGSVLPESISWLERRTQVKELRNCRAQLDVPVAVLCKALCAIGLGDGIGTAGYTGFSIPFDPDSERFYFPGGHGATISGDICRTDIVEFMKNGPYCQPRTTTVKSNPLFDRFHTLSPLLGYIVLILWAALLWMAARSGQNQILHVLEAILIPAVCGTLFLYFY